MKKLVMSAIIATSMFAWGPGYGWHHGGWHNGPAGCGWGAGFGFMGLIRNLNLTETQIEKIRNILAENRPYENYSYKNVFSNGHFDENSYIDTRKKICEENIKRKAEIIKKIYAILTPEQKKELESLINE